MEFELHRLGKMTGAMWPVNYLDGRIIVDRRIERVLMAFSEKRRPG